MRFSPDYSTTNPYQTLLYSDCPPDFSILPGDLTKAQQDLASGEFRQVYFHLHWISPILARAGTAEEVERHTKDYLSQINDFVRKGGRLVWTIHNLFEHDSQFPEVERQFRVQLANLANAIHVHSECALAQIAEHYALPADKVVLQPHGHYIGQYPDTVTRPLARAYLGLGQDDLVFLSLGQIRPYKGIDTLLQAFSALQRNEPRARLVIAGKPVHPYSADLLRHYLRGYRGVTLRPETIPDIELQYYFRAADAAVLTYRRVLTSGSVLLAESFGTACIGPDVPGLNNIIRSEHNGFLYDPDNPVVGIQACFQAVANRTAAELAQLHTAARADAEQRLWRDAVKNLFDTALPNSTLKTGRAKTTMRINTEHLSVECHVISRNTCRQPLVGIVILNYKNSADTTELVQSIDALRRNDLLIVIVDNASPNLTLDELETAFPQCNIVRTDANLGYAAGNNVGIRYLKAFRPRFTWILNPDTVVQRNTLEALLTADEQEQKPTIWGSVITYHDRPKMVWFAGGYVHFGRRCQVGHLYYNKDLGDLPALAPYDVDYVTGASIFCRTEIFDQNGLLPEHYFLYFEETDWCQQAKRRGIQLRVNPKSQLFHKKRSEIASGLPQNYYFYYFIRGAILFRKKYAQVSLEDSISEIQDAFVAPWLARIKRHHLEHFQYFQRLSQVAIADGRNSVGGRRNLYELPANRQIQQNSQVHGLEIVVHLRKGNVIESRVSGHEWAAALELSVVIDGRILGHLNYCPRRDTQKSTDAEQEQADYVFEFVIPCEAIDGSNHTIELRTEDNQCLWQSITQLKTNLPEYEGGINGIKDRMLIGWCIDLANPQIPVNVQLACNGRMLAAGKAVRARPDLIKSGYVTGLCGFEFPLPLQYCDGETYEFVLSSQDHGVSFSRRALRMEVEDIPSIEGIEDENTIENWFFVNRQLSFVCKGNAASPWVLGMEGRARQYADGLKNAPQDILVSVIMPVFNREAVIENALRSVSVQTYRNWELILVDDGSQDGTVAKVHRLMRELRIADQVRLIEQPQNAGVSIARNVALAHSTGRQIAYLDSDNTWDADFLLIMVNELRRLGDHSCVYCGDRIQQQYTLTDDGKLRSEIIGLRYGCLHRTLLENINYIDLNVFMHTRDLYEEHGGFNETMRRLVDWELIVRYAQTRNVGFVPAILATYVFGACDNQITEIEEYRKNAAAVLSTTRKLHEVRSRIASMQKREKEPSQQEILRHVHVFLYSDRDADESSISMAVSNWMNAFSCCEISITFLINKVESQPSHESRLSGKGRIECVSTPRKNWLSLMAAMRSIVGNNDKSWSVLIPLSMSPGQDIENNLREELLDNMDVDLLIPACLRSNSYALKNDAIRFRNSLPEFEFDFQPITTMLDLSSKGNPPYVAYEVIHALSGAMLIADRFLITNKDRLGHDFIRVCDGACESFKIVGGNHAKVAYSQKIRVFQL